VGTEKRGGGRKGGQRGGRRGGALTTSGCRSKSTIGCSVRQSSTLEMQGSAVIQRMLIRAVAERVTLRTSTGTRTTVPVPGRGIARATRTCESEPQFTCASKGVVLA